MPWFHCRPDGPGKFLLTIRPRLPDTLRSRFKSPPGKDRQTCIESVVAVERQNSKLSLTRKNRQFVGAVPIKQPGKERQCESNAVSVSRRFRVRPDEYKSLFQNEVGQIARSSDFGNCERRRLWERQEGMTEVELRNSRGKEQGGARFLQEHVSVH